MAKLTQFDQETPFLTLFCWGSPFRATASSDRSPPHPTWALTSCTGTSHVTKNCSHWTLTPHSGPPLPGEVLSPFLSTTLCARPVPHWVPAPHAWKPLLGGALLIPLRLGRSAPRCPTCDAFFILPPAQRFVFCHCPPSPVRVPTVHSPI